MVSCDVELVGAAVAAGDDHDVDLGDVDHGDRVVDRRMHDVDGAAGEPLALALRAFGEFELDLQAALGKKAAIDRHIKRQRTRGREGVDVQQDRLRGVCQQGEATEA